MKSVRKKRILAGCLALLMLFSNGAEVLAVNAASGTQIETEENSTILQNDNEVGNLDKIEGGEIIDTTGDNNTTGNEQSSFSEEGTEDTTAEDNQSSSSEEEGTEDTTAKDNQLSSSEEEGTEDTTAKDNQLSSSEEETEDTTAEDNQLSSSEEEGTEDNTVEDNQPSFSEEEIEESEEETLTSEETEILANSGDTSNLTYEFTDRDEKQVSTANNTADTFKMIIFDLNNSDGVAMALRHANCDELDSENIKFLWLCGSIDSAIDYELSAYNVTVNQYLEDNQEMVERFEVCVNYENQDSEEGSLIKKAYNDYWETMNVSESGYTCGDVSVVYLVNGDNQVVGTYPYCQDDEYVFFDSIIEYIQQNSVCNLEVPSNVTLTEDDFGEVRIEWNYPSMDEVEGFRVYRSDDGGENYSSIYEEDWYTNWDDNGNAVGYYMYVDAPLNSETGNNGIYTYKVVAVDEIGLQGEASNPVTNQGGSVGNDMSDTEYTGICFVDTSGKAIDELTLHVGEAAKIGLAFTKANGSLTNMVTDAEVKNYHIWEVFDESSDESGYEFNITWQTKVSTGEVTEAGLNRVNDYTTSDIDWLLTHEVIEGKEAYFKAKSMPVEGTRYFIEVRVEGPVNKDEEFKLRLPVKVLAAEEGKTYEQPTELTVITSVEEAHQEMRELMKTRNYDNWVVTKDISPFYGTLEYDPMDDILDIYAEREGMKPDEGDYLHYGRGERDAVSSIFSSWEDASMVYKDVWYTITRNTTPYITTAEEEMQVDSKIHALIHTPGGALYNYAYGENVTGEEKIQEIYNWIVKNVSGTVPGDRRTPIYHTAYHALIKGSGTCEAFALLFTRFTREMGIASKVIMGTDSSAHAYNIVQLGRKWYFIDTSSGRYLADAKEFSRAPEQPQYYDQRFIDNYLSKIPNNDYVVESEGVAVVTDSAGNDQRTFTDLSLAAAYIAEQAALNEDVTYTLTIENDDMVLPADGILFSDENRIPYGNRVSVNLNGYTLIVPDSDGDRQAVIGAKQVSNGVISVGDNSFVKLYADSEKGEYVYEDLEIVYQSTSGAADNSPGLTISASTGSKITLTDSVKVQKFRDIIVEGDVEVNCDLSASGWMELGSQSELEYITSNIIVHGNISADQLLVLRKGNIEAEEVISNYEFRIVDGEKTTLTIGRKLKVSGVTTWEGAELNPQKLNVYLKRHFHSVEDKMPYQSAALDWSGNIFNHAFGEEPLPILHFMAKDYVDGQLQENIAFASGDSLGKITAKGLNRSNWQYNIAITGVNYQNYFIVELADAKKNFVNIEKNVISVAGTSAELYVYDETSGEDVFYNAYAKLQEAFDEIERIGNSNQIYNITLTQDAELNGDYKFPTKAALMTIFSEADSNYTIGFKSKADIKCNTNFNNVTLEARGTTGTLAINGYKVGILDSCLSGNIAITGNGTAKGSNLLITGSNDGSYVRVASVNNVDILSIEATKVYVDGTSYVGTLCLNDKTVFCGKGSMKVGNVECNGKGTIVTFPTVTLDAESKIKDMKSTLEITGEMQVKDSTIGRLNIKLGKFLNYEDNESDPTSYYDGTDFPDSLVNSNKVILAKAPKISLSNVEFIQNTSKDGYLYKKAGNIVYKKSAPTVELSYYSDIYDEVGNAVEMVTVCETFADAVAEINNLKTKRDYKICFLATDGSVPAALTMPKSANINTLTLTSLKGKVNDVFYLKDISFTSSVILEDISFVQMIEKEGNYVPITSVTEYPTPVNVKTSGSKIICREQVSFNTPVLINGGNKAELTIVDSAIVTAKPYGIAGGTSNVQGKITGFKNVNINQTLYLDGWKTIEGDISACTMDVTALTLGESGKVIVGDETSVSNTLKVKDLIMDGSDLKVSGTAELTNVTLAGTKPRVEVTGEKFNITGLLTNIAKGAEFVTTVDNKKQESVLNISGKAVLENLANNRITVQVVDADGESIKLAGNDNGVYFSKPLLKAKNVNAGVFLVHEECTPGGDTEEYDLKKGIPGYFLKKNKDYVEVHYSGEIEVALCKTKEIPDNEEEDIPVINYYMTLNEAIEEIKVLNDTAMEYTILLLDNVGTSNEPYKMTVPEKAAEVTFTQASKADSSFRLYINTNMTQKTNLAFENITMENKGTWDTKNFELEINSADVTVDGKTTAVNLILANGAVLNTGKLTTITDITNINTNGGTKHNEIICSQEAGLTIKGYVKDMDANGVDVTERENGIPKVILDAGGKATYIESSGTDVKKNNEVIGTQYKLSNTKKLVALEKERMDKFIFQNGIDGTNGENVVWASKGIYLVREDYAYAAEVKDIDILDTENNNFVVNSSTKCLDVAEASNYINTVSDKMAEYMIVLGQDISDTKLTDSSVPSDLVLPNKDKAKVVMITPGEEHGGEYRKITFSKDLKVNGKVIFEKIHLHNSTFSVSMEKNSDVRNEKEVTPGESYLELQRVKADGIMNIKGKKGASGVSIQECDIDLSGGITDMADLVIQESNITTNAKSDVQNLTIEVEGIWNALEATTIGNVALSLRGTDNETYMGTYYPKNNKGGNTGIPQLTITGKVTGGKLPVKVYDFATGNEIIDDAEITDYSDKKLVMSKTESAENFVACDYSEYNAATFEYEVWEENVKAYKDKSGYVSNGRILDKQVILSLQEENGWTDSYVKTYAEAIEIINNSNDETAVYKITLRGDEIIILTALENDGSTKLGALALPKAGKAKKLIIAGNGEDNNGNCIERTLKFTGAIQAKCDLGFENIILYEVDSRDNGNTLKTDKYHVEFGTNVQVKTDNNVVEEANLVFKTIDGSKGGVTFGADQVYVSGDIKLNELVVGDNTNIMGKGKITITDISYENTEVENGITLTLAGEKEIVLTNISSENADNKLDITTCYKNKVLASSETQLTVNGELDNGIAVVVRPWIYDKDEGTYHGLTQAEVEMLQVKADVIPKIFQKVMKAPKMMAFDKIEVWYLKESSEWENSGLSPIKHEAGIYFTDDVSGIEVIGYQDITEELLEMYRAEFFTWEQAVKEIDKLNHSDWKYVINVLKDQGCGTPLKSVTMPSKAKKVIVDGADHAGILTTGNKISMKCPTEFTNISVCAVKNSDNGYYSVPLTLDSGKFKVTLNDVNSRCEYDNMGYFNSSMKVTGSTGSIVEVLAKDTEQYNFITQISNVGTVILHNSMYGENSYSCCYKIRDGIKGVKHLELLAGAAIDTDKNEVSVTNLTMGEAVGEFASGEEENLQEENTPRSSIKAANITVSGTTIMASADLRAGTTTVGDGKVTLGNVVFRNTHNMIEGKLDKNGKSSINMKGTVTYDENVANPQNEVGTRIGLYRNNSITDYAMLVEGMTLLTAPKAPSSMFCPNYDWIDTKGTETESDDVYYQNMGSKVDGKGIYKSGNDMKYGDLERNEARLYIGTSDVEREGRNVAYIEYVTLEEAVKAIDSLSIYQKDNPKIFEEYTIELLKDVMIGNEKGDGKFSTLNLPSKASQLTIWGCDYSMQFSGNVTLKCNTVLRDINMIPMKAVKGEAVPTTMNITVGNYILTDDHAVIGYNNGADNFVNCLDKVAGSAKGCLIICEDSCLQANSISGMAVVFSGNGEQIMEKLDGKGNKLPITGTVKVTGNFTVKELKFTDYAAGFLQVDRKFTTDAVCVDGKNYVEIAIREKNPMQIKGVTQTIGGKKITESVFFTEKNGETTEAVILNVIASTEYPIPAGTKVLTGKYLSSDDWRARAFWGEDSNERTLYLNGADLCIGNIAN